MHDIDSQRKGKTRNTTSSASPHCPNAQSSVKHFVQVLDNFQDINPNLANLRNAENKLQNMYLDPIPNR
jgi:hypothetical protein